MNIYAVAVIGMEGSRTVLASRLVRAESRAAAVEKIKRYCTETGIVKPEISLSDVTEDVYKWVKDLDAEEWVF